MFSTGCVKLPVPRAKPPCGGPPTAAPRPLLRPIGLVILYALLGFTCFPCPAHSNDGPSLQDALAAAGPSPGEILAWVRTNTSPDIGRHALRSPGQVLAAGRGNSLERARLLAEMLTVAGHRVRFQAGDLDDAKAAILLAAALPPWPRARPWPSDVPLSNPADDPEMRDRVRRHTWVQALVGESWVDLDPAFDGGPGTRHAEAAETFYRFSGARLPRVELTVEFDRDGSPGDFEELVWWDGPLEAVAHKPLSLRILPRIGTASADGDGDMEPARRLADPMAGGSAETPAQGEKTVWEAGLTLDGNPLAQGRTPGDEPEGGGRVLSMRLKVRTVFGEEDSTEDLRLLCTADETGKLPPFQRHSLLLAVAGTSHEATDRWAATLPAERRDTARARLEAVRRDLAAGTPDASMLQDSLDAESVLGEYGGHLLNLAYCAASDAMSADLAGRLGVHAVLDEPRLVIASFTTTPDGGRQTSLDLRRDRRTAVALPGQPRRIAESFQFGYGVMASALEGRIVTRAAGSPALTTAVIMRRAQAEGIPVRLYSALERDRLDGLGLPDDVRERIEEDFDAGLVVMLPARPVLHQGSPRWGWWRIDPAGRTVGVLDSGLHQAMIEHTLIETEGALSNEMAAVIGAISGATDTQFAISAMVLKHGELTREALEEAKAYMSGLGENLCQALTVEAKAGGFKTLASASVEMEGCFRYEQSVEIGAEAGGSLTVMDTGWCEAFQRGFTCSSMTILNAYLSGTKE